MISLNIVSNCRKGEGSEEGRWKEGRKGRGKEKGRREGGRRDRRGELVAHIIITVKQKRKTNKQKKEYVASKSYGIKLHQTKL